LDNKISTRLSRVCGLTARQRVLLTLETIDDLMKNDKGELFKNSIQAYVQYPKELKWKGKEVAMKIISHAWRSYKSRLVKYLRDKRNPSSMLWEPRSNEVVFMVFPVSWPRRRVFRHTDLPIGSGKIPQHQRLTWRS
jgi:hypothetical protein